MQRLSLGSPAGRLRPSVGGEGPDGGDGKAAKAVVRAAAAVPDKSIHLVPVLTLLCFFVLFLLSRDPAVAASALTDSPVLAATARSFEFASTGEGAGAGLTAASVGGTRGGVYRRLKEDRDHERRLGTARRR